MQTKAYAKLNLTLDILRRRDDGYHDLQMVMQSIDLADDLEITPAQGTGSMSTTLSYLPSDGRNLAQIAAQAFREATGSALQVDIAIRKRIPVCAGMAGGSSDAAAVLRAMDALAGTGLTPGRLAEIGQNVGSDVPYCVRGGTALAEGRGEVLTTLPALPDCHVVLCKPAFSVPTPELFARLDGCRIRRRPDTAGLLAALAAGDLAGVARRMYNVFEDVLPERRGAEVQRIKNALVQQGALGASMSGTGSTVFGLFDREEAARRAYELLQESYRDTILARSLEKMV